ncbi:hypothetical protein, partial [Desulfamplus magnetovallimortis]|uniref:hypothetical protein n=1 Tax=Desulfamplus magnetovallimortis TaxID=1246637 RepID=UPI001C9430F9
YSHITNMAVHRHNRSVESLYNGHGKPILPQRSMKALKKTLKYGDFLIKNSHLWGLSYKRTWRVFATIEV